MFQRENLYQLTSNYSGGFNLWQYKTTDLISTLLEGNYFGTAAEDIQPGDFIFANADTGGDPMNKILVVGPIVGFDVAVNLY